MFQKYKKIGLIGLSLLVVGLFFYSKNRHSESSLDSAGASGLLRGGSTSQSSQSPQKVEASKAPAKNVLLEMAQENLETSGVNVFEFKGVLDSLYAFISAQNKEGVFKKAKGLEFGKNPPKVLLEYLTLQEQQLKKLRKVLKDLPTLSEEQAGIFLEARTQLGAEADLKDNEKLSLVLVALIEMKQMLFQDMAVLSKEEKAELLTEGHTMAQNDFGVINHLMSSLIGTWIELRPDQAPELKKYLDDQSLFVEDLVLSKAQVSPSKASTPPPKK